MKTNFISKIFALSFAVFGTTTAVSAQAWVDAVGGYSMTGSIRALANSGGTLYVGGSFLTANGAAAGHFVTYSGTAMTTPQSSTLTGNGINSFFVGTTSNLGYNGFFALGNYSAGSATQANATKWSGLQWGDAQYSSFATPATTNAMGAVLTLSGASVTMSVARLIPQPSNMWQNATLQTPLGSPQVLVLMAKCMLSKTSVWIYMPQVIF